MSKNIDVIINETINQYVQKNTINEDFNWGFIGDILDHYNKYKKTKDREKGVQKRNRMETGNPYIDFLGNNTKMGKGWIQKRNDYNKKIARQEREDDKARIDAVTKAETLCINSERFMTFVNNIFGNLNLGGPNYIVMEIELLFENSENNQICELLDSRSSMYMTNVPSFFQEIERILNEYMPNDTGDDSKKAKQIELCLKSLRQSFYRIAILPEEFENKDADGKK